MISVSILKEIDNYKNAISKINNTNCDYLHLDIMDNTFTNTFSFKKEDVNEIFNISKKNIDVHLMSSDLDNILNYYISLKPNIISFHFEAVNNVDKYIEKIKENNIKVGLAISPDTKVDKIKEYLSKIDIVLVLGVLPGKGGQKFIPSTKDKVIELYKLKNKYNYLIEVDGGINDETIKPLKDYIDIIVSGSFITDSDDYQKQINLLIK